MRVMEGVGVPFDICEVEGAVGVVGAVAADVKKPGGQVT